MLFREAVDEMKAACSSGSLLLTPTLWKDYLAGGESRAEVGSRSVAFYHRVVKLAQHASFRL